MTQLLLAPMTHDRPGFYNGKHVGDSAESDVAEGSGSDQHINAVAPY